MSASTVTRYIMGEPKGDKVGAFDLDGTLFLGTSKTPYPGALQKLQELIATGYKIIIISNQLRKKDETLKRRVDELAKHYQIPMDIYLSRARDQYRKPDIGILSLLSQKPEFYVGDASGRAGDFSDSDLKFAENAGIPFYTPEQFFATDVNLIAVIKNDEKNPIDLNNTSELVQNTTSTQNIQQNFKIPELEEGKQVMVVMTGYSGSGKSTLSKQLPAERINQDTLKTKAKCLSTCRKLLVQGKSVVIDKTNPSVSSRAEFTALAKEAGIPYVSIYVSTPFEESIARNKQRAVETGVKEVPMIAYYKYRKEFQEPSMEEGFSKVYKI